MKCVKLVTYIPRSFGANISKQRVCKGQLVTLMLVTHNACDVMIVTRKRKNKLLY
jgi:hypothetical protein